MPDSTPVRLVRTHGFSIAALVLVLLGVYFVASAFRFAQDNRWVAHTHGVIRDLTEVRTHADRSAIRIRNFLLGADPAEQLAFESEELEVQRSVHQLVAQVKDNPGQLARARRLQRSLDERDKGIRRMLVRHGAVMNASWVRRLSELRTASDPIIDEMAAEEERLLDVREAQAERSLYSLLAAVSLAVPFSLLVFGYGQSRLRRENRERSRAEARLTASVGQLQRVSSDLEALSSFAGMLQSANSLDELYALTRNTFPKMLPGLAGSIFLIKP